MIALNIRCFTACWRFQGWNRWVFSAGDTRSQASPVLAWSNWCLNLTLLNLTLPCYLFLMKQSRRDLATNFTLRPARLA